MYKVLIVDDEQIIRKGLARIIEMSNSDFVVAGEAANGKEGFEGALKLVPDLVITDVKMPVMDGLEMIDNIKQALPGVRFLVLSAYTDYNYTRHAIRSGVDDYLMKPVNRMELIVLLKNIKNRMGQQHMKLSEEKNDASKLGNTDPVKSDRKVIEYAKEYINKNFFNDISLEDVAKYIHMNTNYFSMLFKKEVGINFIEYLTHVRIDKAKQLLENSDLKIYEVCQVVGYMSTKSFARVFKEIVGMSPMEYKNLKK